MSQVQPAPRFRAGFWTILCGVFFLALLAITFIRFTHGLGSVTNLSDKFPWGIWIGFDLLCGVGLAAGAFTVTAAVHIFNLKKFEPIVRSTLLTGYLGYIFVVVALLFDLGKPWNIWHAIIYWNPHSVMFEVAWCVMLYTTVLSLEFSPILFEWLGWHKLAHLVHKFITLFVILGVILSTLHQSSLGTVYLIVPSKLHPLWYSSLLPLFFFLSAVGAGLGMVILESYLCKRAFGRHLEMDLLVPLARPMVAILGIYGVMKLQAIFRNGSYLDIFHLTYEGKMWLLEFGVGILAPVILLGFKKVRTSQTGLVAGAFLAVLGFVMNRLNVSVTGMERAAGVHYVPSIMEVVVSVAFIGLAMAVFALAVHYLAIFPESKPREVHAPELKPGWRMLAAEEGE